MQHDNLGEIEDLDSGASSLVSADVHLDSRDTPCVYPSAQSEQDADDLTGSEVRATSIPPSEFYYEVQHDSYKEKLKTLME